MKNFNGNKTIFILVFLLMCFLSWSSICTAQDIKRTYKKISCNDPDKKIKSIDCYHIILRHVINQNWIESDEILKLDKNLSTVILITIMSNGQIGKFEFESKSGNELLDNLVINTVMKSIPLPPLPEGMNSYRLGLKLTSKGL